MHDETWPEPERDSLMGHGMLFVVNDRKSSLFKRLYAARYGYRHEVSFKKLSGQPRGQLYEVARRWAAIFLDELGGGLAFKAAFTNQESDYRRSPYKGERGWSRHLRHSISLAALGVPAFAFRGYDHLDVTPVFDETGNLVDMAAFDAGLQLAGRRAARRRLTRQRHYATLDFHPIDYVSSDPRKYEDASGNVVDLERRINSELVQLVDLILGSMKTSLVGAKPNKNARLMLAQTMTKSLAGYWSHPWHRFAQRGRAFTVTIWPDGHGLPYNPRPYVTREPATQATLWRLNSTLAA